MARIRCVCVSDLHLGASNSVLTPESFGGAPGCTSQPLDLLASCLRTIAGSDHPQLVINGDLLEMALTSLKDATLVFDSFLDELLAGGGWPFANDIAFLAGNHDHHLWEGAREVWYREALAAAASIESLPDTPHVTDLDGRIQGDVVSEPYLTSVIRRRAQMKQCSVTSAYPNLVLRNETRAVVFHHGHYVEPIYSLISEMRGLVFPGSPPPADVAELEAENFAWIDFFWSTLGRSGAAGTDIFLIYDKLHDLNAMKQLMGGFAAGILMNHKGHEWSKRIETSALQGLLDATVGRVAKLELHQAGVPLSPSAAAGLKRYTEGPLRAQLIAELNAVPRDLTVVMGHTHKPFEEKLDFDGYDGAVSLFNTGGYVVDTPVAEHCHGGSIVVIDEELNVASIRIYTEPDTEVNPEVRVVSLREDNPLVKQLEQMIETDGGPWQAFLAAASASARSCRARMKNRISEVP